ncbi:MAG TPA: hypothetical protein VGX26_00085, partial [Solirubrobacteraceae bacterium]|nr:hypothetical protein [Solirubrobacteraceae bacterium]
LAIHLGRYRPATTPHGSGATCSRTAPERSQSFEDDRICCERVYFDQTSILRQLGVAHDPSSLAGRISSLLSHPLTIGRALAMSMLGRTAEPR